MPSRSAASRACLLARTLKPMIGAPDASASDIGFGDRAGAEWMIRADFVGAELLDAHWQWLRPSPARRP
jgi:hypothetical protein